MDITAQTIVAHIEAHPGCIKALYGDEDKPLINESELLDPAEWVDVTDEPDLIVWENSGVTWCDGIRFCYEDNEITFEDL